MNDYVTCECGSKVHFGEEYTENSCCDKTLKEHGISWEKRFLLKDKECGQIVKEIHELNIKINRAYQDGWDDCLEVTANNVYRDFNIRIPINK